MFPPTLASAPIRCLVCESGAFAARNMTYCIDGIPHVCESLVAITEQG
jgi:hypothetical protein